MTPTGTAVEKKSFVNRVVVPAGIHLFVVTVSLVIYKYFWLLNIPSMQKMVGHVFGLLAFFSIGCGAFFVYRAAFFRGASPAERIAASLATPLLWIVKEVIRVTQFFTVGESVYYGLSSIPLLAIASTVGMMGMAEMISRYRLKRLGEPVKVVTIAPVASVLFFLVGFYALLVWGLGVHWFYIYQEGYKALFAFKSAAIGIVWC